MALPVLIKNLLENGVHFGHLRKHWNPKMKPYIFGRKKNIYIIDLEKTSEKLQEAKEFLSHLAEKGGTILFVATKRQLKDIVAELAQQCQMPYIVERWIGGFLTNFSTMQKRMKQLLDIRKMKESGELEKLSNKEYLRIEKEYLKMEKNYRGVVGLHNLPDCLLLVDPKREYAAVREARKLGIPIVAIIDTDADPDQVDYPIPGNDDAIKSVRYLISELVLAIQQGLQNKVSQQSSEEEVNNSSSATDSNDIPQNLESNPEQEKEDNKQEENILGNEDDLDKAEEE